MVVGPTKLQPRFLRSLDRAMDSAEVVIPLMVWRVMEGYGLLVLKKNIREIEPITLATGFTILID